MANDVLGDHDVVRFVGALGTNGIAKKASFRGRGDPRRTRLMMILPSFCEWPPLPVNSLPKFNGLRCVTRPLLRGLLDPSVGTSHLTATNVQ
jgi:hypothetical protein